MKKHSGSKMAAVIGLAHPPPPAPGFGLSSPCLPSLTPAPAHGNRRSVRTSICCGTTTRRISNYYGLVRPAGRRSAGWTQRPAAGIMRLRPRGSPPRTDPRPGLPLTGHPDPVTSTPPTISSTGAVRGRQRRRPEALAQAATTSTQPKALKLVPEGRETPPFWNRTRPQRLQRADPRKATEASFLAARPTRGRESRPALPPRTKPGRGGLDYVVPDTWGWSRRSGRRPGPAAIQRNARQPCGLACVGVATRAADGEAPLRDVGDVPGCRFRR